MFQVDKRGNMGQIEFRFDGPESKSCADDLALFIQAEFPNYSTKLQSSTNSGAVGTKGAGTTIAIIALILAAPGAFKNAIDIADRLELKKKMDRLIDWARNRRANGNTTPRVILPENGQDLPLEETGVDQLVNAIAFHNSEQWRKP
jgi:hypothetical protein